MFHIIVGHQRNQMPFLLSSRKTSKAPLFSTLRCAAFSHLIVASVPTSGLKISNSLSSSCAIPKRSPSLGGGGAEVSPMSQMVPSVAIPPNVATVLVLDWETSRASLDQPNWSTFDLGMLLGMLCLLSSCLSGIRCLLCGPCLLHTASEAGGCAFRSEPIPAFQLVLLLVAGMLVAVSCISAQLVVVYWLLELYGGVLQVWNVAFQAQLRPCCSAPNILSGSVLFAFSVISAMS